MSMSTSSPHDEHWRAARLQLREWLAMHHTTKSELARLAGVNRSVITRFLEKDQPLNPATASKLYRVLGLNSDPVEQQHWVQWLNLEDMKGLLSETPMCDMAPSPLRLPSNMEQGSYWLNQGWAVLRKSRDILGAISMFRMAEQAFGRYTTMAPLAACEMIEHLLNLSDVAKAEREIFRVEQTYQSVMDVQSRSRLLANKSMAAHDRRDFVRSIQYADELRTLAQANGMLIGHEHLSGLSQLGMAETLSPSDPNRRRLLGMAEQNMRTMCRKAENAGEIWNLGFQYFRLAQVLREQGQAVEAERYCTRARRCFGYEFALGHIAIEEANLGLLNGQTSRARARAEAAREGWGTIYYAGGLGRCAAVTALSLWMEGRADEALEPAVVAASIAPYGTCYKGDAFVDLPWQIVPDARRNLDARQYAARIEQMREHVVLRQGHFACLTRVVPDRSADALALLAKMQPNPQPAQVWVA
jgi:plasmid maintenance system antidote protein VapI